MKRTKILSLILALCMTVSVFAVSMVSASATEETGDNVSATDASEDVVSADATEASTEPATEPSPEATNQNENKWYGNNNASLNLTSEEANIFVSAVGQLKAGDLTISPIDVMTKQNSSGKTYAYLTTIFDNCNSANTELERKIQNWGNSIYSDPAVMQEYFNAQNDLLEKIKNAVSWWVYVINVDSAGKATLVEKEQIDLNNIKTSDASSGDWTITAKEPKDDDIDKIQSAVKNEIANYSDVDLKIIAQIADRTAENGDDYLFMCYGTKNSKTDLYVVETHNTGEKQEIVKVSIFDLAAYTAAAGNINTGTNTGSATNDSTGGKSYDNTNNANGFIATGQSNITITIALVLIVMVFAVIVFSRKRKND